MNDAFLSRGFLPFVAAAVLALVASPLAADPTTGRLWVKVKVADNTLAETPARVSLITPDGELLDYAEELLVRSPNVQGFLLEGMPAGTYDVRVEGDGFLTEVKRGVPVFAGRDEYLSVVVKPGQGIHVVEYAVACLAREEVAAKLARLEAETARLRSELEALASRP